MQKLRQHNADLQASVVKLTVERDNSRKLLDDVVVQTTQGPPTGSTSTGRDGQHDGIVISLQARITELELQIQSLQEDLEQERTNALWFQEDRDRLQREADQWWEDHLEQPSAEATTAALAAAPGAAPPPAFPVAALPPVAPCTTMGLHRLHRLQQVRPAARACTLR